MGGEAKGQELFCTQEIHQIIWNDMSKTSNPLVGFTFKDQKKKQKLEIYFDHEPQVKDFLELIQRIDSFIEKSQIGLPKRREMFIVK